MVATLRRGVPADVIAITRFEERAVESRSHSIEDDEFVARVRAHAQRIGLLLTAERVTDAYQVAADLHAAAVRRQRQLAGGEA